MNKPFVLENPLPYASKLQSRRAESIDLVVLHCTELPDLDDARSYGQRIHYPESGTGNSGHFYIERNGCVEQWVPVDRIAHHVRGFNERSIGIELVNRGRFPDWLDSGNQVMTESYPESQIAALMRLLLHLESRLENLEWVTGHEDLDRTRVPASDDPEILVWRKRDPGPCFPWADVLAGLRLKKFIPE